jgi:hypothetical protein
MPAKRIWRTAPIAAQFNTVEEKPIHLNPLCIGAPTGVSKGFTAELQKVN